MSHDLHVVLGASGSAGSAISRALVSEGLPTRAVSRRGAANVAAGAGSMAADIDVPAELDRAVEGAATVYMAAQPSYSEWPERFPPMLERVIGATAEAGAKLVMVDNLYGYGPGNQPMTEGTPERAADAKGATRRRMTKMLLAAHEAAVLPVAIGRASDYFGPGADNSAVSALAIAPTARPKGSLRWLGSWDAPHSLAYLPDIARAYVVLGTDPRADGGIWHLPHAEPATGRQFLELVNAELPEPRKISLVSKTMLRVSAPFHRMSKESLGVLYQWTDPFVVDASKYTSVFGESHLTPLPAAVAATVAAEQSMAAIAAS